MPRPINVPALPVTPGGWLACYRYRHRAKDGLHSSAEHLAQALGVSGDTLRRWESGRAMPTNDDLANFADVCGLLPIERTFLLDAFSAIPTEAPPDRALFREVSQTLLSEEFPAYLFDSLFFVRAWNGYMDLVHNSPFSLAGSHVVERIFEAPDPRFPVSETRGRRGEGWLRDFWHDSARLCGSKPYIDTIERLARNPEFSKRWLALGLEWGAEEGRPIGQPNIRVDPLRGTFRVSTSPISMPPRYFLREFVPVDRLAWDQLEARRAQGPALVTSVDCVHWAEVS